MLLWNRLSLSLRQPYSGTSCFISDSPIPSSITSSSSNSPLCSSIIPSVFHFRLKTCFTNSTPRSFTPSTQTAFTDYARIVYFRLTGFCIYFFLFFVCVPWTRLSWPSRQLLSARKYTVSYRKQMGVASRPVSSQVLLRAKSSGRTELVWSFKTRRESLGRR